MKIVMTASEISDSGRWDDFCADRGISVWAMNEGLLEGDHEFTFTEDEAKKYGFIRDRY